jgi:Trk K+ transport system NAD-binding subunit
LDGESGSTIVLAGREFTTRSTVRGPAGHHTQQYASDADPDQRPARDALPLARVHPDRSVELLPNADPTAPDLILLESREPTAGGAAPARRPDGRPIAPGPLGRLRRFPHNLRSSLAAPDRRLINLASVIAALASVSALYFWVVAGVSPIDALSYAFTLLTGAGSGFTDVDQSQASGALKLYAIFLSLCGAAIIGVVYALITDAIIGSRLMRTLGRRPVPKNVHDHVIVCGLGAIGYRVALGLVDRGVRVVAVEQAENGRFVAGARARGIPLLIGDARQAEILAEAGIRTARAVVAATDNDLVNLAAAMNARAARPDLRVVVRVFDPDFALRVQRGFRIRFTRSVSHLAAPAFAAAATGSEVIASVPVGDRRVIVFAKVRAAAGSALEGRTPGSLDKTGECRVLGTVGPGDSPAAFGVGRDAPLAADEALLVAATRAGLAALLALAQPQRTTRPRVRVPGAPAMPSGADAVVAAVGRLFGRVRRDGLGLLRATARATMPRPGALGDQRADAGATAAPPASSAARDR